MKGVIGSLIVGIYPNLLRVLRYCAVLKLSSLKRLMSVSPVKIKNSYTPATVYFRSTLRLTRNSCTFDSGGLQIAMTTARN